LDDFNIYVGHRPLTTNSGSIGKTYLHRGEEHPLFYWRIVAGSEVDLAIETQSGLVPLEIKLS